MLAVLVKMGYIFEMMGVNFQPRKHSTPNFQVCKCLSHVGPSGDLLEN